MGSDENLVMLFRQFEDLAREMESVDPISVGIPDMAEYTDAMGRLVTDISVINNVMQRIVRRNKDKNVSGEKEKGVL